MVAFKIGATWRHARPLLQPKTILQRRLLTSSAGGDDDKGEFVPKWKPTSAPTDTTTRLNIHKEGRAIEKKIVKHLEEQAAEAPQPGKPQLDAAIERESKLKEDKETSSQLQKGASVPTIDSEKSVATAEYGRKPLTLRGAGDVPLGMEDVGKDVVVRSRTTTGQVLWPATQEDIDILSDSTLLYPAPYEVEGSVIIRLVRLSDPVTSPVSRTMRNRQFGIRGNEKWQLLAMGVVCFMFVFCLGFWQLQRMEWKKQIIEMRRNRLGMPGVKVSSSPFPWHDQVEDYLYRVVDARGVFDHRREMLVGPRPGVDESSGETSPGYLIITPLILEDGSKLLVNRGHVPAARVDQATRPEVPTWVRVRGVLEEGELPNMVGEYARLKNRPDKSQFLYLVAEDLAENAGARNHIECAEAVLTAFDMIVEDDLKAGFRREMPFSMRHKEDYLLFWADEHTHFNYAMQWFGMGSLILSMTIYKFIEVSRWRF